METLIEQLNDYTKNEYKFIVSKVNSGGLVLTIIISLSAFIVGFVLGVIYSKLKNKPKK